MPALIDSISDLTAACTVRFGKYTGMRTQEKRVKVTVNGKRLPSATINHCFPLTC